VNRNTGAIAFKQVGTYRSPIWADSVLYVIGALNNNSQLLIARNELGGVLWTSPKNLNGSTGAPALGHGVIVVAGANGSIEGLRASDGASLWSTAVGLELLDMAPGVRNSRGTHSAPAIADSVVYIGSLDGNLYALDLATGSVLWSWNLKTPISSSAAISGNMVFVGACDGHLYAFQPTQPATDVQVANGAATVFSFYTPRPNPARFTSRFEWVLPERSRVNLAVYDVHGRLVRTVVAGMREAGEDFTDWDGRDERGRAVGSGIYFARLSAGERSLIQEVVRLHR
jgi:hypothetical protein